MSNFSNNNSITELILLRETGRSKINKVVFIDLKEIPDRKQWQDKKLFNEIKKDLFLVILNNKAIICSR